MARKRIGHDVAVFPCIAYCQIIGVNLGNIARFKVRPVDGVVGQHGVFVELANAVMLKIRAEIFKGFGLTSDAGEKLY